MDSTLRTEERNRSLLAVADSDSSRCKKATTCLAYQQHEGTSGQQGVCALCIKWRPDLQSEPST